MCRNQRRMSLRLLMLLGILLPGTSPAQDIDRLIDSMEPLSPSTEELNSFEFTAESLTPFGASVSIDVAWSRPDKFGMLVRDSKSDSPVGFHADGQALLYDVTTRTATIFQSRGPSLVMRATHDRVRFDVARNSSDDSEFTVDLRSFFKSATAKRRIQQVDAKTWQVTVDSNSGKSVLVGIFQLDHAFPVRRLAIHSKDDESQVLLSVDVISVNQPVCPRLTRFPKVEQFPREVEIQRLEDIKPKSPAEVFGQMAGAMRAMLSLAALRDPDLRTIPLFKDVDWVDAARADEQIGPQLRKLLTDPGFRAARAKKPLPL